MAPRELEFFKRVTHGWGPKGEGHQRLVATIGDVFLVPGNLLDEKPGIPEDVANEMRAKGYAQYRIPPAPAETASPEVSLPAAPQRPGGGLASKIR